MKIINMLVATIFSISIPVQASAFSIELESHEGKSGGSFADITGEGTGTVTFDLTLEAGTVADMLAFYVNISEGIPLVDSVVNSLVDANNNYDESNVITAAIYSADSDLTMPGTGLGWNHVFEFGLDGLGKPNSDKGKGDIREINFTIYGSDSITLGDDFGMRLTSFGDDFGMRLTSFGDDRGDSRKMIGERTSFVNSVPEPTTMLLFGVGVAGLAAVGRRRSN